MIISRRKVKPLWLLLFLCCLCNRLNADTVESMNQKIKQRNDQLEEVFNSTDASPDAKPNSDLAPIKRFEDTKAKSHLMYVGVGVPERVLYMKISTSLLRFEVDESIKDEELEGVITALRTSCFSASDLALNCDASKRNSIQVDPDFWFKVSREVESTRSKKTSSTNWTLSCADSSDRCLKKGIFVKLFKLSLSRSVATNRVIAHGFDVRATNSRLRKPSKSEPHGSIEKVYVTRTR